MRQARTALLTARAAPRLAFLQRTLASPARASAMPNLKLTCGSPPAAPLAPSYQWGSRSRAPRPVPSHIRALRRAASCTLCAT